MDCLPFWERTICTSFVTPVLSHSRHRTFRENESIVSANVLGRRAAAAQEQCCSSYAGIKGHRLRAYGQKSEDVVRANSFFPYSTVQCSRHQHANRCAECDPFSYVVGCGPDRCSYCHANGNSDVHYHTAPSCPPSSPHQQLNLEEPQQSRSDAAITVPGVRFALRGQSECSG